MLLFCLFKLIIVGCEAEQEILERENAEYSVIIYNYAALWKMRRANQCKLYTRGD